ncbi:MAG: aminopeptidase [Thermodesulfobacteriota bacterium]
MTPIRSLSLLAISVMLLCGSGCRLGYYLHLAGGQLSLLAGSVPVEEALRESTLSRDERERLRLVARIKEFGETELGLQKTENYRTVYLKSRQNPIYTVSASPKDRLTRITWWFPIVGDMPYLGFFDVESARKEKEDLLRKDLDVAMGRADAYSTLGWFNDPVTRNLLDESVPELAETILHEMTHTTLYMKGQGEFNEGLAMLVGLRGARLFLEREFGPSHPFTTQADEALQDERIFTSFMASLMDSLERLYNSFMPHEEKLRERERLFALAMEEFHRVRMGFRTDRFLAFGNVGLNNAYLLSLALYHRNFLLMEAYLRSRGDSIPEMMASLRRIADGGGNMLERMR